MCILNFQHYESLNISTIKFPKQAFCIQNCLFCPKVTATYIVERSFQLLFRPFFHCAGYHYWGGGKVPPLSWIIGGTAPPAPSVPMPMVCIDFFRHRKGTVYCNNTQCICMYTYTYDLMLYRLPKLEMSGKTKPSKLTATRSTINPHHKSHKPLSLWCHCSSQERFFFTVYTVIVIVAVWPGIMMSEQTYL